LRYKMEDSFQLVQYNMVHLQSKPPQTDQLMEAFMSCSVPSDVIGDTKKIFVGAFKATNPPPPPSCHNRRQQIAYSTGGTRKAHDSMTNYAFMLNYELSFIVTIPTELRRQVPVLLIADITLPPFHPPTTLSASRTCVSYLSRSSPPNVQLEYNCTYRTNLKNTTLTPGPGTGKCRCSHVSRSYPLSFARNISMAQSLVTS